MKWIKATLIPIGLIFLVFLIAHAGRVKPVNFYVTYGWTASEMLQIVVDSSTTVGYELKRDVMSPQITMASTGEDTVWSQLFTVPAGQTITVEEMILSARIEASGTNDSCWGSILYYQADGSTLDTAVARFPVDADSLAYDDTVYTMTLVDTVFTGGMIVTWWQENQKGAVTGGDGAAVTIKYRLSE